MLGLSERKRTINENARLGGDDLPESLVATEVQLETEHADHGGFDTNRALIDRDEEDVGPHREIELAAAYSKIEDAVELQAGTKDKPAVMNGGEIPLNR